tara:strand:+ start:229 stop:459 length:231 start_codon:yes stop_codon:yes gene_type:complete
MVIEEELKKEILDILDNVYYWETCPQEYNDRIDAVKKKLTLTDVSNCPFEAYAVFCIECDRQGMKPIKYKDYLNLK